MLRYVTAGESHGQYLAAILEGVPAGLKLSAADINRDLARRQKGYGRGGRMKIESDSVIIAGGVRWGETTGSPVLLLVANRDYKNNRNVMSADIRSMNRKLMMTRPRPGHADLAGILKYMRCDVRDISERSSARETAARAAAGAVCRKLLSSAGIDVFSWVEEIGGVRARVEAGVRGGSVKKLSALAEKSPVRCPDEGASKLMMKAIDRASAKGDTLGGIVDITVTGVPAGLGSHAQWDLRLDGNIARSVMSVQAVKGVEIGAGFMLGAMPGSVSHDEILHSKARGYYRASNNSGGLEGGMTTGGDILVRAVMKPIPSLRKPLATVDIRTKKKVSAEAVRSDVCAVPACGVVAEGAVAFEVAKALLDKFGGDSMTELLQRCRAHAAYLKKA